MFRRGVRRTARRTTRRVMRRRMLLVPGRRYRRRRILVGGAALILVGGAAYKIGQNQAQQIQQHTGKPPEDLSPEELEGAMDELGIDEQELTPQDKAVIEAEAVDESPVASGQQSRTIAGSVTSGAPEASTQPDYILELERLADLRDRGIISAHEFEAKKKQLLGL